MERHFNKTNCSFMIGMQAQYSLQEETVLNQINFYFQTSDSLLSPFKRKFVLGRGESEHTQPLSLQGSANNKVQKNEKWNQGCNIDTVMQTITS